MSIVSRLLAGQRTAPQPPAHAPRHVSKVARHSSWARHTAPAGTCRRRWVSTRGTRDSAQRSTQWFRNRLAGPQLLPLLTGAVQQGLPPLALSLRCQQVCQALHLQPASTDTAPNTSVAACCGAGGLGLPREWSKQSPPPTHAHQHTPLACVRSSFPELNARRVNSPASAGRRRSACKASITARTTAGLPWRCSSAQSSPV